MHGSVTKPADLSALSALAPELADMLVSVASDIALVIDAAGVVQRVAVGGGEMMKAAAGTWVGRPWIDTVTEETRQKVEELLRDVAATGTSRPRHLNHPSPLGLSIPITYTAVRLGEHGPVLVLGRDMGAVASVQQKILRSQQELERTYWQARQAESHYRLLFHTTSDAVVVVDAGSARIIDANAAAAQLFGLPVEQLTGRSVADGFARDAAEAVEELLAEARAAGRASGAMLPLADGRGCASVSVLREGFARSTILLFRLRHAGKEASPPGAAEMFALLMEHTLDAVVITDAFGRVLVANPAFADLVQWHDERTLPGRAMSEWMSGAENNLSMIIAGLRAKRIAPLLTASLRTEKGQHVGVEFSAAILPGAEQECFGFIMRPSYHLVAKARADALSPNQQVH